MKMKTKTHCRIVLVSVAIICTALGGLLDSWWPLVVQLTFTGGFIYGLWLSVKQDDEIRADSARRRAAAELRQAELDLARAKREADEANAALLAAKALCRCPKCRSVN